MGILDAPGYSRSQAESRFGKHLYNMDASKFMKWNKALAKMRNGEADAKLLCLGDSTTAGIGSSTAATVAAIKGYPRRLAELINASGTPAASGLALPKSSSGSQAADTRWTGGTNWALDQAAIVFMGFGGKGMFWRGVGITAGNLVFADSAVNADTFDVYYRRQPGSSSTGTFDVTATGGSTTTVDAAATGGATRIEKVTVSAASAATSNTVTIAGKTAAKTVDIVAVEPYLAATRKIRVGNGGASGSQTLDWVSYYQDNTANSYNALYAIRAYAPDLTIIDLGINDAGSAVSEANYASRLSQIITACQASGDVLLKTMLPSGGSAAARIPYEDTYVAYLKTLGLPLIDIYKRSVDYSTYFTAGFMQGDGLHGNDYSYLDEASFVFDALRRI